MQSGVLPLTVAAVAQGHNQCTQAHNSQGADMQEKSTTIMQLQRCEDARIIPIAA